MFTSPITEAWLKASSSAGGDRLLEAATRWYRLRRDTRRLMTFNDYLLGDLGLGCGEIEQAVRAGRPSTAAPRRGLAP